MPSPISAVLRVTSNRPGDLAVEAGPVELRRAIIGRVAAAQGRGHLVARPVGTRDQLRRDRDERGRPSARRSRRIGVVAAGHFERRQHQKRAGARSRAARMHPPPPRCAGAAAPWRRSSAACCSRFRRCRRPPCRPECAPADCAARPRRPASRARSRASPSRAGRSSSVERTDVPAAVERSKVAVGLVPAAVSESGGASPVGPALSAGAARRAGSAGGADWSRRNPCGRHRSRRDCRSAEARSIPDCRNSAAPLRGLGSPRTRARVCARYRRSRPQARGASCAGASPAVRTHAAASTARSAPTGTETFPQHAARASPRGRARRGLMVNGCKTRMVNAALNAPVGFALAPFPC